MAEEKTFRYGFIMLGFFLVMTGMFIMSVEKPQIYATFCAGGILLIAVGVTWSMCQCYPRVGHEGWGLCPGVGGSLGSGQPRSWSLAAGTWYAWAWSQMHAGGVEPRCQIIYPADIRAGRAGSPGEHPADPTVTVTPICPYSPSQPPLGPAPLVSLLEDMDTASLESSVPDSPSSPQGCSGQGEHPGSPRKASRKVNDLYYGLGEGSDILLEDSDHLFEPEK
uniref:BSND protein n=1 Tax=Meleagris gallopavo TaxID=9103 RepID=A0A803YL89_MELGA